MPFLIDISEANLSVDLSQIFVTEPVTSLRLSGDDYDFISWGDPICTDRFSKGLPSNRNIAYIVNNLYGHYYYFFHDRRAHLFLTGNSMFSILPLYYHAGRNRLMLSDNALFLGRHAGGVSLSKRFVLETALFNYPLTNTSAVEGISLVPSNSGIVFGSDGMKIVRHTSVEELFRSDPLPWKRSTGRMAEIFLETAAKYLPDEHYFTALTGGLDGRTLTASGRYHERSFSCYCFGTTGSKDIRIASGVASASGIPFLPVILDEGYCSDQSLEKGKDLIIRSSGNATFTRAHYLYAAGILAEKTKCIVTGNFGSEIFRAVHVPGVVIAPNLYSVFSSDDPDEAMGKTGRSAIMQYLNRSVYQSEWAEIREEIESLPCFGQRYRSLDRNRQFYIFVFEELFRKYFGAEITCLMEHVRNRTPFLDMDFLKELLATELAGAYSGFFERNPLKRYKGQVLYAHIIRKAFPPLGRLSTDKGYRPDDLISLKGKIRMTGGFIWRRLKSRDSTYDPYGVRRAWELNHKFYESLAVNEDLFDGLAVKSDMNSALTNERARIYSLIYLDNYINKYV